MIYTIHAGDAYGLHDYFVIEHPDVLDVEALLAQFKNSGIQVEHEPHRFKFTETFIEWLILHYEFRKVETIDLATEN